MVLNTIHIISYCPQRQSHEFGLSIRLDYMQYKTAENVSPNAKLCMDSYTLLMPSTKSAYWH